MSKQNQAQKPWYRMEAKGDSAEIVIYDQIGQSMWGDGYGAKKFNADLKALGNVKNISVRLNSPGGDVFEGLTILNRLLAHKATVTIYIDGLAASIASVIAMAGDKIVMAENALFMIHNPWSFAMGTSEDMRATADTLDKVKESLLTAYTGQSNLDEHKISALMDAETWMTAKEALDMGFVDEIGVGQDIQNSFDLSRFKNPPKAGFMQSGLHRDAAMKPGKVGDSTQNSTEGTMTKNETTETTTPATPETTIPATPTETTEAVATGEQKIETPATPAETTTTPTEATPAETPAQASVAAPAAPTEADNERTRVLAIMSNAFPGQDTLVQELIKSGASVQDSLSRLIVDAKSRTTQAAPTGPSPIEQLRAAAPKPAGWVEANSNKGLTHDEQVKSDWDADKTVQAKFNGDFSRYKTFRDKTKDLK